MFCQVPAGIAVETTWSFAELRQLSQAMTSFHLNLIMTFDMHVNKRRLIQDTSVSYLSILEPVV
jgi:hypothetical protein